MGKVKVMNYTISLDGYGAGPDQSLETPMGKGAEELHQWMFSTRRMSKMLGKEEWAEGVDNDFVEKAFDNLGAWIMGRNMFGPIRGEWPDDSWKGWWGPNPPYHVPVFVLTHYEREPLVMEGGTTFYFVTKGIDAALDAAKKAAEGKDIRIGGGASTVRQFLKAGYIDELHLAVSPIFLGSGEHLFRDIDMISLGYNTVQRVDGELATHILISKG
jgi:dihydrofolate reductase